MAILAKLHHSTRYRYDRPVTLGPQIIRLRPAPHCRTPILGLFAQGRRRRTISSTGSRTRTATGWRASSFPRRPTRILGHGRSHRRHGGRSIRSTSSSSPTPRHFPFAYADRCTKDIVGLSRAPSRPGRCCKPTSTISREARDTVDFLVALNQRLQHKVTYVVRMEPGVQTPEETLELGSGSCRDTAWLLVQILRHLGLAARFVSGYLIQLTPDVKSLDGPSGTEHDFTDLHAWAEVYLPGAGWVGLDPTSGLFAGEGHIPLAATPHYRLRRADHRPVSSTPAVDFDFDMTVERIDEKPRVTTPFSDEAWHAIDALGDKVDADLRAQDVRLTMGGEPTFVSIDDYQAPEWNTEARRPDQARARRRR